MEIEAVIVIEVLENAPNLVQAFTRDDNGIKKAHELFKQIAKQNNYSDDDIQVGLCNGYIESAENNHSVGISYS